MFPKIELKMKYFCGSCVFFLNLVSQFWPGWGYFLQQPGGGWTGPRGYSIPFHIIFHEWRRAHFQVGVTWLQSGSALGILHVNLSFLGTYLKQMSQTCLWISCKPCSKTHKNTQQSINSFENGVFLRFSEWWWKLESKLLMQFGKYIFLRMNLLQCTGCLVVTDPSVVFYMSFVIAYCPVDAHILTVQQL